MAGLFLDQILSIDNFLLLFFYCDILKEFYDFCKTLQKR